VTEYREKGYLPEALVNYLAMLGWNPGTEQEIFSIDELIKQFSLEKVQKAGAVFNLEKLNWFNKKYIEKLDDKTFLEHAKAFLPADVSEAILVKVLPLIKEKISFFGEIPELFKTELSFIYPTAPYDKMKLMWKQETDIKNSKENLKKVIDLISPLSDTEFTKEKIKETVWPYAEEKGRGFVLWPMRYALSGQDRSPDPFVISEILGKEETLKRLTFAHDSI
jgi:glutamyl/glutaminyl-tRNA synthetase